MECGNTFRCTKCGYTVNGGTSGGETCNYSSGPKVTCPTCNGSGDGDETTCTNCRGSGSVSTTRTCTTCKGDKTVTTTTKCDHDCTSQHYYCTEHGNNVSEYHE